MVARDPSAVMTDSTAVRRIIAPSSKKGIKRGLGRSRGGSTTKLHAGCDGHGRCYGQESRRDLLNAFGKPGRPVL